MDYLDILASGGQTVGIRHFFIKEEVEKYVQRIQKTLFQGIVSYRKKVGPPRSQNSIAEIRVHGNTHTRD